MFPPEQRNSQQPTTSLPAQQVLSSPSQSQQATPHIEIDTALVATKKALLADFYAQRTEEMRLQVLTRWPTREIGELFSGRPLLHKTNNGWYIGSLCNEMFHGYGLLIYRLGATVNGLVSTAVAEKSHSELASQSPSGSLESVSLGRYYQGQFQNNCKHGYGMQYISGDLYIGRFINNKPEDLNGIFMWRNRDIYMGGFVNGMKHGAGRWESGPDYYEGSWKLNRPQGNGRISTPSSQYEGDVKNGFKHGLGIEVFGNGDRYQGLYANGKPEGDGTYSWKNGAIYKGQFKNGIRYGYGVWTFGNQTYEGDYVNDKRNGQGTYRWGGGSYYKGAFLDDLRHGFGEMFWGDKTMYRGEWREGVQCGQGETWEDGALVSKGIYEDGKFVREQNSKLQNSNATEKSYPRSQGYSQKVPKVDKNNLRSIQQKDRKASGQKYEMRYPVIQQKQRSQSQKYKSDKNPKSLSQIDEFPNVHTSHRKKHAISTSFSHQKRNPNTPSPLHNLTSQSNNKSTTRYMETSHNRQQQEQETPHNFAKRLKQENEVQSPAKYISTHDHRPVNHLSSKRTLQERKKMHVGKIGGKEPREIGGEIGMMTDTQLRPIKWKNFQHMKNTSEFGHSVQHF